MILLLRVIPIILLTGCASSELVRMQKLPVRQGVVKLTHGNGEDRAKMRARILMHDFCQAKGFQVSEINQDSEITGATHIPGNIGNLNLTSTSFEKTDVSYIHFVCKTQSENDDFSDFN